MDCQAQPEVYDLLILGAAQARSCCLGPSQGEASASQWWNENMLVDPARDIASLPRENVIHTAQIAQYASFKRSFALRI
jgi:hypothetical protein